MEAYQIDKFNTLAENIVKISKIAPTSTKIDNPSKTLIQKSNRTKKFLSNLSFKEKWTESSHN